MTFVPASSFEPAIVTVAGTVAVSNFPASQAVTGPLTAAELLAAEPLSVSGPVTVASLPLPAGAATEATLDRVKRATNDLAGAAMLDTDAA